MDVDKIIQQLERFQAQLLIKSNGTVEVADPATLSATGVKIRVLLVQLVDKLAIIERDYRHSKAAMYDKLIKEGVKKSPALDQIDLTPEIIDKRIEAERIRGYAKYVDSLVSSIQTHIKVQTGIARNDL